MQKSIIRTALLTAGILLIPFFGNIYVDGWNWHWYTFVFAGVLLFGAGLTYELVARKGSTIAYRAAVGIAVGTAFILVWTNLATGLIGSEDNPANVLYLGVLAVGFIGAILARLEPRGMARALIAMALAQFLVPVIALLFWKHDFAPGVAAVFIINGFFAALFVGSALLFRRAAVVDRAKADATSGTPHTPKT